MFKKPVWDNLCFITWCIITLEAVIKRWINFGHKGNNAATTLSRLCPNLQKTKKTLKHTNNFVEISYIMKLLTTGSLFPLINVSFKPFKSEHIQPMHVWNIMLCSSINLTLLIVSRHRVCLVFLTVWLSIRSGILTPHLLTVKNIPAVKWLKCSTNLH